MYMYNVPICCHSRALNWPLKLIKIENIVLVLWCYFLYSFFSTSRFLLNYIQIKLICLVFHCLVVTSIRRKGS